MFKTLFWIEIFIGLWLMVAPFILNYASLSIALWNDIILGLIVGVVGLVGALNGKN